MSRALTGTPIDRMPMTVHRGEEPPRHLLVDAQPLHDGAGATIGAVACAVDVTILRAREAELHAFADVVAHDLKTPLTGIAGFSELAADALNEEHPDLTTAQTSLVRVIAGTARMRTLIDDLFGYATARDAVLQTTSTDLRSLVDDVVTARIEQPRPADCTPPRISVGPLATVQADPVLLRQLIENLVGNALKYTPPGQPARIDITACADRTGWTRVEIADRGIGIPAGQHAAVPGSTSPCRPRRPSHPPAPRR